MRKHYSRRLMVVLLVSLLLAQRYVEYGKWVKASEAETGCETEWESESETETEVETETGVGTKAKGETETEAGTEAEGGTETETGTEAEGGTETEAGTENEGKIETEIETEAEGGTETEAGTETEGETETEIGTETEGETETETGTETEGETETEIGTETETESEIETESETQPLSKVIRIRNIRVDEPKDGRIYDGTDQISLIYDVELPEGETEGTKRAISCEAHLTGSDVGEWDVVYQFQLAESEREKYSLEIEEVQLKETILPRPLSVVIPDGWKVYGSEAEMDAVHLLGEVQVSGFLEDKEGKEIIPKGFKLPKVEINKKVIGRWSDIYEKGKQKVYQDVLMIRFTKDGKVTGNPTKNYRFETDEKTEYYSRGNLVIVPSAAVRGADYGIQGDDGCFYQAPDGRLWVRRGSGLHVYPLEGRGYNCGADLSYVEQSGTWTFTLKNVGRKGEILSESLAEQVGFSVDDSVPGAEISVECVRTADGICYGKRGMKVSIQIPEDTGSGMKSAHYFLAVGRNTVPNEAMLNDAGWQDCMGGTSVELIEGGTYVMYVETEDWTGNKTRVKSSCIIVDNQGPQLEILGVKDNSANRNAVNLRISCSDLYYRKGSLSVEISGANGGTAPKQIERKEMKAGEIISFADFPHEKSVDDIYTVQVWAEDLSGNETQKELVFSVNRFGSVYDLSNDTKESLSCFYHPQAFPVVFLETNIDYVGEAQIICRRNGTLMTLQEGRDFTAQISGDKNGWKRYCYTVSEKVFAKEGKYEVILLSKDRARNSSDSLTQRKMVQFMIDRTAPECLITGIEPQKIYQAEELWVCMEPRDNGSLQAVRIYLDGQKAASYGKEEIGQWKSLIKWRVPAGDRWRRLQVYISDEAGNEYWSEEIPFFVTEEEQIEQIEPYRKLEKSARELEEERRILEEKNEDDQKSQKDGKRGEKEMGDEMKNGMENKMKKYTEKDVENGKQKYMQESDGKERKSGMIQGEKAGIDQINGEQASEGWCREIAAFFEARLTLKNIILWFLGMGAVAAVLAVSIWHLRRKR